jgi:ribosomal protein S18 acetylase RimI-like enzyme
MSCSLREYQPEDLERCRELWRALSQRHRDIYGDSSIGGDDPGLELDGHLRHPGLAKLWVAASEGEILGFCGLLVQDGEAELEPIVVDPAHRGRGIGARLARAAIDESRRLGVAYVNVRPVGRNLEAIRFFHREGFQLLGRLELSIPLEGATPFGTRKTTCVHGLPFDF